MAIFSLTTTQAQNLEVDGDLEVSGNNNFVDIRNGSSYGGFRFYDVNTFRAAIFYRQSDGYINISNAASLPGLTYNVSTSHVGIGVGTPDQALEVRGTGFDGIHIQGDDAGDARLWISNGGGSHFLFDDDSDAHNLKIQSANALHLRTGGSSTPALIADTEQRVVVNRATTANLTQFYVNTVPTSGSWWGVIGDSNGSGSGSRYAVAGYQDDTPTGNLYGVYGSCTSGTGQWAGYFAGNFYYTGTLTSTSDARLKKNIQEMNEVLPSVMSLKPKSYEFNQAKYKKLNLASGPQIGFLSQDVEEVFPDLVHTDTHIMNSHPGHSDNVETEVEIKSLDYISMVPILTKAIQEQQAIIEDLKAEVQQLRNEIKNK